MIIDTGNARRKGRSLRLFLADGTATGVITAQLGMSSLVAACVTRVALPSLLSRVEAQQTGVYLLVVPDPNTPTGDLVYVGEGDEVGSRLADHDNNPDKDFFSRIVLIISKDNNLTKAHARYLEARLIGIIRAAGRAKVKNRTDPPSKGRLPEGDEADMEIVLEELELLLPVLGYDLLRVAGHPPSATVTQFSESYDKEGGDEAPDFVFTEAGTNALAREIEGEFVVLEGSFARGTQVASCDQSVAAQRSQMQTDKILVPVGDGRLRFSRDVGFTSTSRAACVVYGGNASGPQYWKHAVSGQSYKEWRADRLKRTFSNPSGN